MDRVKSPRNEIIGNLSPHPAITETPCFVGNILAR